MWQSRSKVVVSPGTSPSWEWLTKCVVPCDSQSGMCLFQCCLCDWDSFTPPQSGCDWQMGLWLSPWFPFSLEESSGSWNSSYSISAELLRVVMRMENKLNNKPVYFSLCHSDVYKLLFTFNYPSRICWEISQNIDTHVLIVLTELQ